MTNIIGHAKILNFLHRSVARNTVSQAYLFWGPENVGKFSLALEFSKELTGGDDSKINPNLVVVEPESSEVKGVVKKQDIKVGEIRELQKKISLTPNLGKHNVAIINDAERLTKSAQNSLLKTLEEPPRNSVIILVASDKSKLLPTVLSRCQMIKFSSLSNGEIEKILPPETKNKEKIIFWSMGRPGLAKRMVENRDELKLREESMRDIDLAISARVYEKFYLAEALSKNVPLTLEKLDWWVALLRKDMLEDKNPKKSGELESIEKINTSKEVIKNTNANVRLVLENLFLSF